MNIIYSLDDLSDLQKLMLPKEKDIRFYEQNGWYISDKIIPDNILDDAKKGAEEFYIGKIDFTLKNNKGIVNDNYNSSIAIRNNEFVTLQKKELHALGFYPMISAIAAALARTTEIRLFSDSLINKSPEKPTNKGIIGWHSDKAYWPTCSSDNLITAWVPLQDCTKNMGPLIHINKSHLWKDEKELKPFFSFNNQDLSKFENYLKTQKPNYIKTLMTLKRGQVSFHNCNTIHGSFPNTSNKDRLALAIHLQDKSNTYKKAYKETGELIEIGYDKICKKDTFGNPDYKDVDLFPVIFREGL
ncbi:MULTISPECIES: phytanoyl-CoA dioxygenase family protein [Tenacibaculum]|uniref:phytanoyl-CoA dioxygenase family protein n=1 Tax=Tenacibaculum TaxID=104267 RepID=UPI001F0A40D0|nr:MULTISPECIES: phytanoyl-CoA dioxygenase family protein [Tenacibaculum]MCH3881559.1 phytanoyl-CoA dioxygenase family protein [Tenacibaculum aquimarinum]MDO6598846.1 phytanoyl-CoA dioxygenase family protein [Tenacibaculum sp. 1_MG-2023]